MPRSKPFEQRPSHCAHVPQEIWDQVIVQLQDDFASLKCCSLVCSSWCSASRKCLYRTLTISPKSHPQIHQHFASSRLLPLLKGIAVREFHLPHQMIHPPHPGGTLLHTVAPMLAELHLYRVTFDTFTDLMYGVSALKVLRILIFDHVSWNATYLFDLEESLREKNPLPQYLEDLRLRSCKLQPFSIWLTSQPPLSSLSHLEIRPVTEPGIVAAGDCLYHLGPHIQHLDISFSSICDGFIQPPKFWSPSKSFPSKSNLALRNIFRSAFGFDPCDSASTFRQLHQLHIHDFIESSLIHQPSAGSMAPHLIASIPGSEVEKVVFYLRLQQAGELDIFSIKWDFFDAALTSDAYSTLKTVEFVVAGRAKPDGVASLLALRLPRIAGHGVLRVLGASE